MQTGLEENSADFFTKILVGKAFKKHEKRMMKALPEMPK